MELGQAVLRIGLINVAINLVLGLGATFFLFRHTGASEPAPFIKVYADLTINIFLMGFAFSWIMAEMARNMIRVERLYVDLSRQIQEGARWKTKGFLLGLIIGFSLLIIMASLGFALNLIFKDLSLDSLRVIMIIKAVIISLSAYGITWLSFGISARNQDALRRAGLNTFTE